MQCTEYIKGKSVFDRQKKSEVVKHKRGGAPGSGSFLGPWAPPPKDPCDVNPDDDKEEVTLVHLFFF